MQNLAWKFNVVGHKVMWCDWLRLLISTPPLHSIINLLHRSTNVNNKTHPIRPQLESSKWFYWGFALHKPQIDYIHYVLFAFIQCFVCSGGCLMACVRQSNLRNIRIHVCVIKKIARSKADGNTTKPQIQAPSWNIYALRTKTKCLHFYRYLLKTFHFG